MANPFRFVDFAQQTGANLKDIRRQNLRSNVFGGLQQTPEGYQSAMQELGRGGDIQGYNAMSDAYSRDVQGRQDAAELEQQTVEAQRQGVEDKAQTERDGEEWLAKVANNVNSQATYAMMLHKGRRQFPGSDMFDDFPQDFTPEVADTLQQFYASKNDPNSGTQTDIWRYAGLAEQQWAAQNPGVPMPPELKMQAMLDIKRAQPAEAAGVRTAVLGSELEVKPKIAEEVEVGKLKAKRKFQPEITRAIKLAEKEASERGDVLTDLSRAKSALPGLLESVGQMKELALLATSTFGGRFFDAAVRESGFGATKGANARAKFIAMVNNQVLPLLKPTFGAAFTVAEGDSLRATMGDPNLSPAEKMEQLTAFIDQKVRDIQTKERQLGQDVTPTAQLGKPQVIKFDAQGNIIQ